MGTRNRTAPTRSQESPRDQILRLGEYLLSAWGDDPSWGDGNPPEGKGAVDLAIAILERHRQR